MVEGLQGVIHRNRGRPSNRKFSEQLKAKAIKLVKEKYHDFKPTFAGEKLADNHKIHVSKETLRQWMIKAGIWKPKKRKMPKQIHTWRARKENYGEMQQFDGSYHKWFEDRAEECCLLAAIDDATGEITQAKFDHNEGTRAVHTFWWEYLEQHGLPVSIYLDKFSTYKINHPSAVDNKELMTQFQRAMNQIGTELISAHSPEAKGRVERLFNTLQDRLVKELRLANISTLEAANLFLVTYIPKFNKQFAVEPAKTANLHQPLNTTLKKQLPQIFSIQNHRKVHNDYTIMFKTKYYQLKELQPTTVYKKDTVTIEEHLNGELKIYLKDHYLNFTELPERPKKKNLPVVALTRNKTHYCPPKNHPWRKFQPSKKYESEKQLKNATAK
jgi:hypothetical protein